MTVISKTELAKIGAKVRLEEVNKERDALLDFLGYPDDLKSKVVKGKSYNGKHWTQTPEGRKKMSINSKKIWKAKKNGR